MKILIVSWHTNIDDNSVANKCILEKLEDTLNWAEFDYLCKEYPDYIFDIGKEQQKLLHADVIVFQYPLFWYAMPSILQKWIEDVFQHWFSHWRTWDKLTGKKLVLSITAWAPESAYEEDWLNIFDRFVNPAKYLCKLCHMEYSWAVVTYWVSYQQRKDHYDEIIQNANEHVNKLVNLLDNL